jgi:hypothetical protein
MMAEKNEKGPEVGAACSDLRMRLLMTGGVSGVLAFSLFVFASNAVFPAFGRALEVFLGAAGFQAPAALSLGMLLSAVVLLGLAKERLLSVVIYTSWALFLPSALFFSKVDWTMALNLNTNLSAMSNALPDIVVFLNGLAIVGVQIMLSSYLHLKAVRSDLLGRGAEETQVDLVTRSNLRFTALMLGAALAATSAAAGAVVVIAPLFGALSGPVTYAYVAIGLAVEALLIALFIVYVWRSDRSAA